MSVWIRSLASQDSKKAMLERGSGFSWTSGQLVVGADPSCGESYAIFAWSTVSDIFGDMKYYEICKSSGRVP